MAFGDLIQIRTTDTEANAYAANVAVGSLLVSAFRISTTATINSVTDTRGNTWQLAVARNAGGISAQIWYAYSASAGANTVTADCSDTSLSNHHAIEYTGPFANVPLQDTSSNNGTGTALTTGIVTGTRASTFYFAYHLSGGSDITNSSGPGFISDWDQLDTGAFTLIHRAVSGAADVTIAASVAASQNWWSLGATFNPQGIVNADSGAYALTGFDVEFELASSTTGGFIFDYVLAQESSEAVWPSRMTQMADWAVPVYLSGERVVLYTKSGSNQIWVLGANDTGTLASYIDLPWMSRLDDTKVTKWLGLIASYASTVPVDVYVRYANNPGEFDAATFVLRGTLPANPTIAEGARIGFGGSTRWVQVRFRAETLAAGGFELFPPVHLIPVDTLRSPN